MSFMDISVYRSIRGLSPYQGLPREGRNRGAPRWVAMTKPISGGMAKTSYVWAAG